MIHQSAEYSYANRNRSLAAAAKKSLKAEFAANLFAVCCYTEQADGSYASQLSENYITNRFSTYEAAEAAANRALTDCVYDAAAATWFRPGVEYAIVKQ